MKYTALSAAVFALVAIVACKQTVTTTTTTNKPTTEETPSEPAKDATSDASTDSGAAGNKKDSAPEDQGNGECAGEKTQETCINCCVKAHETGSDVYFIALIDCICQPSQCATECADTMCNQDNPANPDAACNACMGQKNAGCQQTVSAACSAEPDCLAFDKCVGESVCTGKN